ncbi:MAG TPA: M23 family metallopeptidase [Puia sp.]
MNGRQCLESFPIAGFRAINALVVNDEAVRRNLGSLFLLFLEMVQGIIFLALLNITTTGDIFHVNGFSDKIIVNIIRDTMRLPINGGRILTIKEKNSPAHRGIFIQPSNDFNVRSVSNGKVQNVFKVGAGWAIVIMQNDTSYAYAQMDSVMINPGEFVNKGDLIGERKLIPNDYKSIIFFVLKGKKELDPEKFIVVGN